MDAFPSELVTLVALLDGYIILLRLNLFPKSHSFFILQLQDCFMLLLTGHWPSG